MSNEKQTTKQEPKNSQTSKDKPLFEDLQGHKHDDASYQKLMNERKNRTSK